MTDSDDFHLEVSVTPHPRMVAVVRRFVEDTFDRLLPDADAVFRIGMAAHELLENAARYGTKREPARLTMSLEHQAREVVVRLALSNRAAPAHLVRLRHMVQLVTSAEDPMVLYYRLMGENLEQREESGLGLCRIRAEGGMALSLDITDTKVSLVARVAFAKDEPPAA